MVVSADGPARVGRLRAAAPGPLTRWRRLLRMADEDHGGEVLCAGWVRAMSI